MQSAQQPNLAAGFKNNIGPQIPQVPQVPQVPQMSQMSQMPQMQQMTQMQQVPQMQQMPQIQQGGIIQQLNNDQVIANIDTISIFGQAIQKKYFYLFLVLILAVIGYFIWKWYSGKEK